MRRSGLSLVEMIAAIIMLLVIILAASSMEFSVSGFFESSRKRANILNEMTFVLEHLAKNVLRAVGDINDPGIEVVTADKLIMRQGIGSPKYVLYTYNSGTNTLNFCSDWTYGGSYDVCNVANKVLTERILTVDPPFSFSLNDRNGVIVSSLQLKYDIAKDHHIRKNPIVWLPTHMIVSSPSHSIR
ncbi:MAG: hypothetical protein ABH858_00125 [Candidatus Omnitrophota bacterium]